MCCWKNGKIQESQQCDETKENLAVCTVLFYTTSQFKQLVYDLGSFLLAKPCSGENTL